MRSSIQIFNEGSCTRTGPSIGVRMVYIFFLKIDTNFEDERDDNFFLYVPFSVTFAEINSKNYQTKHDTRIQSYLFDLKVIQLFSGDRIISCQLKQKNHFEIIVLCKNHTATKL